MPTRRSFARVIWFGFLSLCSAELVPYDISSWLRKMMLLLSTSSEDLLKAIIIILHNLWKKRSNIVHKGGPKSPSHLCNSISYTINYIPPIFCSSILLPSDPQNVVCQTSHLHLKIGP